MLVNREAFFVTDAGQDWDSDLVEFCGSECAQEFGHFHGAAVMDRTFTELDPLSAFDQSAACDWCGAGIAAVLLGLRWIG